VNAGEHSLLTLKAGEHSALAMDSGAHSVVRRSRVTRLIVAPLFFMMMSPLWTFNDR
jgi:hypothetical protein